MRSPLRIVACRGCGSELPASELDNQRWCRACRARVLARASRWARIGALVAAVALLVWIVLVIGPSTRFLVAWMVFVAATYLIVHRIVRRVAFEIIRSRDATSNGKEP